MMLVMTTVQLDDVYGHGAEGYPHECCGLLLGTPETDGRLIVRAVRRARNANTERTRDRYEVHPEDFAASDREAERNGWEILGCYHSHPDHPAIASVTDLERGWGSDFVYLIVSIVRGEAVDRRAWLLDGLTGRREETPVMELEPQPEGATSSV